MKRITFSALILACGLASFQACQVEDINNDFTRSKASVFHITANPSETKSVFGDKSDNAYPTLWTTNKDVAFSRDEGALAYATPTLVNGGAGATFDVELTGEQTEGTIYAFSPKGVYDSQNPGNTLPGFTSLNDKYHDVYLNIPSAQTPLANSVDESAQAIVGSVEYTEGEYELDMSFTHVVAYGKMTVSGFEGKDIASVAITFPEAVAGSSCYYYYAGESAGKIDKMTDKTIVLDPANVVDNVFWFAVAPVAGNSGAMKVAITDTDDDTYTKTIDLSAKALPFVQGQVAAFTVDFTGIEADKPAVVDGDYAILALDGNSYYAVSVKANATSQRRDRAVVSYDGTGSIELTKSDLIWTITAADGAFTIANGDYFMGAGKNTVPLVSENAAAVSIVANGDGTYTLTADCGTDGTRYLAMNGTNGFGWYASTTGVNKLLLVPAVYAEPTLYDITVSPTTNGTVSASLEQAEAGENITVTVTPAEGYELSTLTYNDIDIKATKSFTMPDSNVTIAATFALKEDGGSTGGYTLVTDASSLSEGDVIVLGCSSKGKAAGAMGNSKFLSSVDATFTDGGKKLTSEKVIEITLGGSEGAWTLTTSEGNITSSAAKALILDDGTQQTWTISISNDGTATITGGNLGSIQYNASSPRFANYTSSQTAIQIYKK